VVTGNGFNRFPAGWKAKPLKRLGGGGVANTGLKPGVNERRQETEMRPFKLPLRRKACVFPSGSQDFGMQSAGPLVSCLRALNAVRRGVINTIWLTEARCRGLQLGRGIVLNGRPYLQRVPGSKIVLGDRICLNSTLRSNPIGCSRPVSLVTMQPGAEIILGAEVGLSSTAICAALQVTIGTGTFVGADSYIFDNDFHSPRGEWNWGGIAPGNPKPVVIGRGVFIGARAIVLKGVTIGDRAVVGAGSVVTKDVPPGHIAAGNPIRIFPPRPA
jgi:acetyltransferase-like isoleucine patch superfamily enzyme